MLERKARFINMAMSGDRSIRRIEDVGSNVNQFAMAKALASGDDRLMKKAGLDAEVARLLRLRDAHIDDQHNIRRTIRRTTDAIAAARRRIERLETDVARRHVVGDGEVHLEPGDGRIITDRKIVGERLVELAAQMRLRGSIVRQALGSFNGFEIEMSAYEVVDGDGGLAIETALSIRHNGEQRGFEITDKTRWNTLISRLEASIRNLDAELASVRASLESDERRLPAFEARLGQEFPDALLLEDRLRELAELEADLASTKGDLQNAVDEKDPPVCPDVGDGSLLAQAA